jgi:plasmid stabilization system protein ParE
MRVRYSGRAREDLRQIALYIGGDNPTAARRWVSRLIRRVKDVARTPRAGRRVPELDRDDIREVVVGAYRIIYKLQGGELRVLTVFEGHMRLRDDLLE